MKDTVYIKETRREDKTDIAVYTTLKQIMREMGIEKRYMTAYNILVKGKNFIYGNIIIKRTKLNHNERRNS